MNFIILVSVVCLGVIAAFTALPFIMMRIETGVEKDDKKKKPSLDVSHGERIRLLSKQVSLPKDMESVFYSILGKVLFIQEHTSKFDIQSKHLFENTIIQDTEKLLEDYSKLTQEEKKNYHHTVLSSLVTINEKLEKLENKLIKGDTIEIEKTIEIVEKRYKK